MNERLYLHLIKYGGVYASVGLIVGLTLYTSYRFDGLEKKFDEKIINEKKSENVR